MDAQGRTRVPYGFATDRWADLGNLAVYRHDNGADAYELFDFFITEQEVNHIFDNYRRGRESFSVRSAVSRTLERYNEKMRDGAKGLGLYANIYRDFALAEGYDFETLWLGDCRKRQRGLQRAGHQRAGLRDGLRPLHPPDGAAGGGRALLTPWGVGPALEQRLPREPATP